MKEWSDVKELKGHKILARQTFEEEKKGLLEKSEISVLLDTYEDIFSDFDPRPFHERSLSDDFLREAKKFSLAVKTGGFQLRLMIPEDLRDLGEETLIKKRLREHFKSHSENLKKEQKKITMKGLGLSVAGFAMMIAAAAISLSETKTVLMNIAFVVLEPAGWFSLWYGLDNIFYIAKEKNPELEFYEKMTHAEIDFVPY